MVDIIEPRVAEILDLIQKELKKINKQEQLPGGIVLTGGGVKLPKIKEITKETLKLACEIGIPKGLVWLPEDPALATVAGLALQGVDFDNQEGILGGAGRISSIFKKIFRAFKP